MTVDGRDVAARSSREPIGAGRGARPRGPRGRRQRPEPVARRQPHPARFRHPPVARGRSSTTARRDARPTGLRGAYAIARPTIDAPVRVLSGGNLQRLILAREIDAAPKLLVAVQPTRGLDVGAIEGVHQTLLELRERGTAILLISEELEELLALADRIVVMYEGRIAGQLRRADRRRYRRRSACT